MAFSFRIQIQLCLKNARLPPVFFLDSDSPCKDLLYLHRHKPRENTVVLVGKFKKSEYLGPQSLAQRRPKMHRTYV